MLCNPIRMILFDRPSDAGDRGDAYFSFTRQPKGVSRPSHAKEPEPAGVWANAAEVWAQMSVVHTVAKHLHGLSTQRRRDECGEAAAFVAE